jgi:hypothetical protein
MRNLQAQPKMLKKIVGTSNQPIRIKNFPKKSIFSILKKKRSQKFVWGLPNGIYRPIQNPEKMIGTPNLPNKMKMFPKKYV